MIHHGFMPTAPAPVLRRRSFLMISGVAFAGLVVQLGRRSRVALAAVYGELVEDPEGIMDLPPGFFYRILDSAGELMDDGYAVPGLPDGMATFAGPGGTVIVMRNHELRTTGGPYGSGQAPPEAFDTETMGSVTRLVVDGSTFERLSSNLVLCGTLSNCAGGPSPWGWLSCEENTAPGHGYVFVCDPLASQVQVPISVPAFGRFRHEAACVDPASGRVYLTEDREDSCLYRFVPNSRHSPFEGRLQALRVVGVEVADTGAMAAGVEPVAIDWVDIDEPDPEGDTVRAQAQAKGAAIFIRGEGITFTEDGIYAVATTGGPIGKGQIFRLIDGEVGGHLEVMTASVDPALLDMPDNITMAAWGELFFCEDGRNGNYLRGLTADGALFNFARNVRSTGELAGVCLSPDGRALFVNMQQDGMTLVITGPFPEMSEPGKHESSSDGRSRDGSETAATADRDVGAGTATAGEGSSVGAETATAGEGSGGDACQTDPDGADVAIAALLAALIGTSAVDRRSRGGSSSS